MPRLPLGKLPGDLLQAILDKHAPRDPRVIVGPRVGEDAAVIDAGDRYLVVTSDPITFATDELGWYALHVNANDVVVRGATPRWFLATLLLPAGTTDEAGVRALFGQLAEACDDLEVALVGGHTEVTHGLDRPIVAGTMLGEVAKDKLVTTGGARVGDAIVLTKGVPLEGAAIIAREKEAELRARGVLSAGAGHQRSPRGRAGVRAGQRPRDARSHGGRDRDGAARAGRRGGRRAAHRPRPHHGAAGGPAALRGLRPRSPRHDRLRRSRDDAGPCRGGRGHPRARARVDRLPLHRPGGRPRAGRDPRGRHHITTAARLPAGRDHAAVRGGLSVPLVGYARRPVALGREGMVASAHPYATVAGLDVLRAGG